MNTSWPSVLLPDHSIADPDVIAWVLCQRIQEGEGRVHISLTHFVITKPITGPDDQYKNYNCQSVSLTNDKKKSVYSLNVNILLTELKAALDSLPSVRSPTSISPNYNTKTISTHSTDHDMIHSALLKGNQEILSALLRPCFALALAHAELTAATPQQGLNAYYNVVHSSIPACS